MVVWGRSGCLIGVEAGVSSLFNIEQTDSQELLSIAIGQRTLTDENINLALLFSCRKTSKVTLM